MGSYPWGPHGPQTSPYDVKPNPTAQTTFPNIGGGGGAATTYGGGVATYGGGAAVTGSGGPFLSIALSLIMMPLVWMFWICLYPLTATVGAIAGIFTVPVAFRVMSLHADEANVAAGMGFIVGYIVVAVVSRIEYRMAKNIGYRVARHIVRLLLFGALALPWIQAMVFDVAGGSEMRYILGVLSHPSYLLAQMATPQGMAIVLAVMIGMHFLLWKAERVRNFWHRRLMWIGLK